MDLQIHSPTTSLPARKDALPAVRARSAVPRAARAGAKSNARVTTRSMCRFGRDMPLFFSKLGSFSQACGAVHRDAIMTVINYLNATKHLGITYGGKLKIPYTDSTLSHQAPSSLVASTPTMTPPSARRHTTADAS